METGVRMQITGKGGILGQKFISSASLNIVNRKKKIRSFGGLMLHNYNLSFAGVTINTEKSLMNGERIMEKLEIFDCLK